MCLLYNHKYVFNGNTNVFLGTQMCLLCKYKYVFYGNANMSFMYTNMSFKGNTNQIMFLTTYEDPTPIGNDLNLSTPLQTQNDIYSN